MANGPNLGLVEYLAQSTVWYTEVKALLRALDGLVQASVKDKDLTSPPGSPANGDRYIVGAAATGAWSTHDGKIARYQSSDGTGWEFFTPTEGWAVYIQDENLRYVYTGAAWIIDAAAFQGVNVTGTGQQSLTGATEVAITWGSDIHDTPNAHSTVTATEKIIAWVDGYYRIFGALNYAFHATGARWAYPFKNGAGFAGSSGGACQAVTQSADTTTIGFYAEVHLDAGDEMTCIGYQTSGGALDVNRASSHFGISLIAAD